MDDLQRRMASLLELGATPRPTGPKEEEALTVPQWTPLVDIVEDEKEYLIKAELPEVRREDVRVTVQEGTLNLTGERKVEKEEKGRRLHRVERFYGRFERSFTLPEDADAESVKAEFKDGVLRVHVAKSEKAQPKQIDIKVS
jgi:HSP20 family protein